MPLGPATVPLDASRRAGQAIDLALRIRRHGRVSIEGAATFAALAGISAADLRLLVLPLLEHGGMVALERDAAGGVRALEEQVGVAAPVLEQCSTIWEAVGPTDLERCAIQASDEISYAPYARTDLQTLLEVAGHPSEIHEQAFVVLRAVELARVERSPKLREDVFFSPYVWGTEAVAIAEFLAGLPPNERAAVAAIARQAAERPCVPARQLGVPEKMLNAARKNGLIDLATVMTTGGDERQFSFPPGMDRLVGAQSTDANHERKLFTAHILNGHLYGYSGTGRIRDPLVLVDALIRNGSVGPASAIRTDYPLLESHGIVRVEKVANSNRAFLHLVKEDVARDARDILSLALADSDPDPGGDDPMSAFWLPGTFVTPERNRQQLPEIAAGPEAEIVTSLVEALREDIGQKMRGEKA
ncbi:MAG: hypothetical protein AB7O78_03120 [Thermoleophilia bacterium]